MDMYGFYTGQVFNAYEYLGAHTTPDGVVFRTFAPNALKVSLILGDREIPMPQIYDGNFYEVTVSDAGQGDRYEYRIYQQNGNYVDHCDPYGFHMELRPNHKSIVYDLSQYKFHDAKWMRQRTPMPDKPLNIYEMHLGSWRRKEDGTWYRYDELAPLLAEYLKKSGYNYVEFLPLGEHPVDESWGYQSTGFFSPTSRYGKPTDLMKLVDVLHQNGIGVILDFVPVHFAVDPYGLSRYDGTALYEYPHRDVGFSEWGSCNFIHARGEVRSFLQSAANYWLKEYHFDGLRIDAVSRIIYWQGDEKRGENGSAVDFIKVMNRGLKESNPGCMLIAEDSTNYPNITLEVDKGGLGFDYKWDMGWMHDTLEFFQTPPAERPKHYHKLTFSMMYFRNERYLLPFSHDEVVHGKATILQKMNGQYPEKFPQARAMYLYMMVHPGKKLNFMGNEIGQLREWDEKREQDWDMRTYPAHDSFYHFMVELNRLYLSHRALFSGDYRKDGFFWLDCHQEERCLYAIRRTYEQEKLIAVFNFSDHTQEEYAVGLHGGGKTVQPLLYSDWERFGGTTRDTDAICCVHNGQLVCTLKPFSALLIEINDNDLN